MDEDYRCDDVTSFGNLWTVRSGFHSFSVGQLATKGFAFYRTPSSDIMIMDVRDEPIGSVNEYDDRKVYSISLNVACGSRTIMASGCMSGIALVTPVHDTNQFEAMALRVHNVADDWRVYLTAQLWTGATITSESVFSYFDPVLLYMNIDSYYYELNSIEMTFSFIVANSTALAYGEMVVNDNYVGQSLEYAIDPRYENFLSELVYPAIWGYSVAAGRSEFLLWRLMAY